MQRKVKSDMHDELMVREQLEEDSFLSLEQMRRKTQLIHSLMKINEEELYWFKRSHEKWLLEGTIILSVRPGAAGLPTNVEYSRVRDSTWYVPYHIVTTCSEVELVESKETTR